MDDQDKVQDTSDKVQEGSSKAEEKETTKESGEGVTTSAEEEAKSSDKETTGEVEQSPESGNTEESGAQQAGSEAQEEKPESEQTEPNDVSVTDEPTTSDNPDAKWYVVHTYSGHENKVSAALKQRIESEHLEHKILDILVPTQEKIEIRGGKKIQIKEKIFPGYILVKMVLDDNSWLAVRTTQGVTSFVGMGNKPTPIPDHEVKTIVKYMEQGPAQTFKDVYSVDDTIKIIDGPFADFIGKIDAVDKEKGKLRVLVSIFGRETPVELDFLQVQKL